jgi:hypothetical protein
MTLSEAPPKLADIERALLATTELLAVELASPTDTAPQWNELEWRVAQAVAAMHGVSPLLARTLRWQGPLTWQSFVQRQREHTHLRHVRIVELLEELDTRASAGGIAFVPLKGAALCELGIYQAGDRPMADIDILVAESDREATGKLLRAMAYDESVSTWRNAVFETSGVKRVAELGEHCANPIKIELHCLVAERQPVFEKNISSLVWPDRPRAGTNSYRSVSALMLHLLLHAFGNICDVGLRMIQLQDIALLARRMSESDWDEVLPASVAAERWWLFPPLQCLSRYYPASVPARTMSLAASHRPWLLKLMDRDEKISSLSLSNARVQAFPAIRRAGSVEEMCRYVAGRIRPGQDVIKVRRENAKGHPGAAGHRWAHASQGRRVLHWLFSRPTRMETMSSVNAALAPAVAMSIADKGR